MERERIEYLSHQYIRGTADTGEKAAFLAWVREEKDEDLIREILAKQWEGYESKAELPFDQRTRLFQSVLQAARLLQEEDLSPVRSLLFWKRMVAAASVAVLLLAGYFLFQRQSSRSKTSSGVVQTQAQRFKNDVDPGQYKARLTLADGKVIILDSVLAGQLATQGGTVIVNKNGQLVYQSEGKTTEVLYNTLTTAKGETYTTVLADGSKVWLNSASSIRFPVAFTGNERRVEITGEAYFEVAQDHRKKFIVSSHGVNTEVLGTHFNINAYANEEAVKVTLLEGSVLVSNQSDSKAIKPGQQASAIANSPFTVNHSPDLEEVMAWKDGRFYFENSSVESIMKQVERWYDVEVVYKDQIPHLFVAKIPREVPISELLKLLELTDLVHFKIEGKKITVMK